jgi:hypothetical protein
MDVRILDLDGGVVRQELLVRRCRAAVLPLGQWGPHIRLACGKWAFRRFERALGRVIGTPHDDAPLLNFTGSGDFHHVSLALLQRLATPCNLLVIDNHPDWMRAVPFLHCGTWLYHAARLPAVGRVFHVGGEVDFDNSYHWLAPWPLLRSGKICVLPARRRFEGRNWNRVPHEPLRRRADEPAGRERVEEWLAPWREELAARPLYVSLDKDVLADEGVVNWDSGHLCLDEVVAVLEAFVAAAGGRLAGMDVVGDWSPVRLRGLGRRLLHWTEHPPMRVAVDEATRVNERLNLLLLERLAFFRSADSRKGLRLVVPEEEAAGDASGQLPRQLRRPA